jgi:aspartate dehydrogenase
MEKRLNVGLLGCGTIGGFVLRAVVEGKLDHIQLRAICNRSDRAEQRRIAEAHGIKWVNDPRALLGHELDVIVEAASHEALEDYGCEFLGAGMDLIPLSLGALVDSNLLENLIDTAAKAGSVLFIPSGGIGGLDALQAAIHAGIDEVSMTSRKPPEAWKGIPYVEKMKVDLDNMNEPFLLYDGPARDCVKEFPQNINIAAALSLAGVGFDATRIRIMADPTIKTNTHEIECKGEAGRFRMVLENVPVPENPKTTYQACLSAVAALKRIRSPYHIGT